MLSNTGLFATQPTRFEEYENDNDYLSYEPISDLSLLESPFLDFSTQTGDHFLDSFTSSKSSDSIDEWDWPSSPMSSNASNGYISPVNELSNQSSIPFDDDDSYIDFQVYASIEKPSPPLSDHCASPEPDVSSLSPREIAELWTIAFPDVASPLPEQQTIASPITAESASRTHLKRQSTTKLSILTDDGPTPSKRRHVEEKESSPRCSKRNSTTPCKGSKLNHNLIEKRYRSSLNEKIGLLRETLPKNYGNNYNSDDSDDTFVKKEDFGADGRCGEGKQTTKGAVLSDAARYIRFLEGKVNRLEDRLASVSTY